ncbi:hypothetical protein AAE02nite_29310 [Adhaeribacter aerolatus]|uniref:Uncharacterized protein n=1 Tax=Adhaeribacter aerolatus TaxID=670289 RepID=A0A512B0F1_9BACT|nr:carboxypeptidase-like regulatory domain-containing protein [Adhaeribacter aerolatus]GEO05267.1 hypothetical protein AAE02nite_29310 [Adhaeribacter aerolatus]
MKSSRYFIWTLVIGLILNLSACEDYLQETQETVVRGNVYDTNKQQAAANATVYIQRYEIGNSGWIYKNILDSVKTDANGNYAITLKGEKYKRPLKLLARLNNAKFKNDALGQRVQIYNGEENKIDFKVIELHPLRLRAIVKDNPRPPLTVQLPQAHEKKAIIYGVNADSTILLMVIPNQVNEVAFHVVHPIRNNNVMSHFDTINAKGLKPIYLRTYTVYPDKFKWESK